ncbi:MAG: acylneuraminate cytidylyltransferase family protein [Euryarchaeota archaeon]|nr:acylneuraminate cytidylyltransferase family protein [Euryarchaeota archaeon]
MTDINKLNIIGVITARGGSVGVPLKNIRLLHGKPLIYYIIKAALGSKYLKRVIVSTDHDEIARISRQYGAEVPFKRPADISEDVPSEFVIQHAVTFIENEEKKKIDIVLTLQPTTPLVNSDDIDDLIKKLVEKNADSAVTVREVREYPWWMMKLNNKGWLTSFLGYTIAGEVTVRQNLDTLFIANGAAWATKRNVLMNDNKLIGDKCTEIVMPYGRSFDIDTEFDFTLIEAIMNEMKMK